MSGTSADGIDVALVRIQGRGFRSRLELLAHYEFPYPAEVRRAILAAMNAASASVADLSRLNFLLGDLYADAVRAAQRRARLECELVGCHGQTLYHQGSAEPFPGSPHRVHLADGRSGHASQRKSACRWSPIFVLPTWPPAARARRWCHFSTTCSTAIAATGASCRTSAASAISRRFRRARCPKR